MAKRFDTYSVNFGLPLEVPAEKVKSLLKQAKACGFKARLVYTSYTTHHFSTYDVDASVAGYDMTNGAGENFTFFRSVTVLRQV